MSAHTKHDDLPPEAFGVELDPLPPWARADAGAKADRVIHEFETEERGEKAYCRKCGWRGRCLLPLETHPPQGTCPACGARAVGEAPAEAFTAASLAGDANDDEPVSHGGSPGSVREQAEWMRRNGIKSGDPMTPEQPATPALPPDAAALVEACEARAALVDVERGKRAASRSDSRLAYDLSLESSAADIPALCALVRAQQGEIDGLRSTIATLDAEYVVLLKVEQGSRDRSR